MVNPANRLIDGVTMCWIMGPPLLFLVLVMVWGWRRHLYTWPMAGLSVLRKRYATADVPGRDRWKAESFRGVVMVQFMTSRLPRSIFLLPTAEGLLLARRSSFSVRPHVAREHPRIPWTKIVIEEGVMVPWDRMLKLDDEVWVRVARKHLERLRPHLQGQGLPAP